MGKRYFKKDRFLSENTMFHYVGTRKSLKGQQSLINKQIKAAAKSTNKPTILSKIINNRVYIGVK